MHSNNHILLEVEPSIGTPQLLPACPGTLCTMQIALVLCYILGARGNGALIQQLLLPGNIQCRGVFDT